MTKYVMSEDQKRRRRLALIIGTAIPMGVIGLIQLASIEGATWHSILSGLIFLAAIGLGFGLAIMWGTRKTFIEKEKKSRGGLFGFFTGLLGLFLAELFAGLALFVSNFIQRPTTDPSLAYTPNLLEAAAGLGVFYIISLLYGGFLSPLLGWILGYVFSRDTVNPDIAQTFD